MINRRIVSSPEWDRFDYFNDYQDTRLYLLGINRLDLVERLDEGYEKWLKQR